MDEYYKCHIYNDGDYMPIETDFFDGKCDVFVHGYCCVRRETGIAFFPWQRYSDLETAQQTYERAELERLRAELEDAKAALALLGVTEGE